MSAAATRYLAPAPVAPAVAFVVESGNYLVSIGSFYSLVCVQTVCSRQIAAFNLTDNTARIFAALPGSYAFGFGGSYYYPLPLGAISYGGYVWIFQASAQNIYDGTDDNQLLYRFNPATGGTYSFTTDASALGGLWTGQTGAIVSVRPYLVGSTVYAFLASYSQAFATFPVSQLNSSTPSVTFAAVNFNMTGAGTVGEQAHSLGEPVYHDGFFWAYHVTTNVSGSGICKIDPATGVTTRVGINTPAPTSNLVVYGGWIYFGVGASLLRVNMTTGEAESWVTGSPYTLWSGFVGGDNRIYFLTDTNPGLLAFDPTTLAWDWTPDVPDPTLGLGGTGYSPILKRSNGQIWLASSYPSPWPT
jgi:hypothetical protein